MRRGQRRSSSSFYTTTTRRTDSFFFSSSSSSSCKGRFKKGSSSTPAEEHTRKTGNNNTKNDKITKETLSSRLSPKKQKKKIEKKKKKKKQHTKHNTTKNEELFFFLSSCSQISRGVFREKKRKKKGASFVCAHKIIVEQEEEEEEEEEEMKEEEEDADADADESWRNHPAFWEKGEDGNAEDWFDENSDAFQALKALLQDDGDLTTKEKAEMQKQKGNGQLKYKMQKMYIRKAVEEYTLGIAVCADALNGVNNVVDVNDGSKNNDNVNDGERKEEKTEEEKEEERKEIRTVLSQLYNNRAFAALNLGNNKRCIEDAEKCLEIDATNIKAYFRAATACKNLFEYERCLKFCKRGLEVEKDAPELKSLKKIAKKRFEVEKAENEKRLEINRGSEVLAKTLTQTKKIKWGPPRLHTGQKLPEYDEQANEFAFFTLIVYPEFDQTDVIQQFRENDSFKAHLDVLFDPNGPPLPWDEKNEYDRSSVRLYYETNAVKPYEEEALALKIAEYAGGDVKETMMQSELELNLEAYRTDPRDRKFVALKSENWTLADVMKEKEYVVSGHPTLFCVVKGSAFEEKFLNGQWTY